MTVRREFLNLLTDFRQARALYDFQAQPGSGEIDVLAGEMITVLRMVSSGM